MPIRIAYYVHWAGVGGAEDMVIDQIRYSDRNEFEYIFMTEDASGWSASLDELQELGVPIHRVRGNGSVSDFRQILVDNQIQLVHVLACGDVQYGYQAAMDLQLPIVEQVACVSYSGGWERYGKVQPVYLSHKHWVHGSNGKDEFKVIVGGVDLDRCKTNLTKQECKQKWGLDPNRLVVGWFGRFDQFKCPFSFLDIAKFVKDEFPDCQFIMFGDGVDRGRAIHLATTKSVDIRFPGFTRDKATAFGAMDVFCFPTWQESFGRVMVEAMAAQVPIVTNDYAVCKEICDASAFYIESAREDPMPLDKSKSYANAISLLLESDDELRRKLGFYGSKRANQLYDARRSAVEYNQLYREMIEKYS